MLAQSRLIRQPISAHTQLTQSGRALCTSCKERLKKVFGFAFFKKRIGSQGDALRRSPQRAKSPHRSKNAGEGEFLCRAKKEGEPSSGVLLFVVSLCYVLCRFLKKAPQKLSIQCFLRTLYTKTYSTRHPERSKAESNFFVPDPKRRCAPFAPHCVRSSTALRMTRTKKRRAKQGGIYEQSAHNKIRSLLP